MGYKLSGYDVIGGVEIDPEMMKIYRANHNPKYSFEMGVEKFNKIPNDQLSAISKDLFNLDILDGSPPCSSFSMAGAREDHWQKKKKFREGQASQVLDDLFFHFIETAQKLQPKVVVAENVKGLVTGKAKGYVKQILQAFSLAGYDCQLFLLNAAFMGVPQRRERVFFIARRKNLGLDFLKLQFNENIITAAEAVKGCRTDGMPLKEGTQQLRLWQKSLPGDSFSKHHPKGLCYTSSRLNGNLPAPTVTSQIRGHNFHWSEPRNFSESELIRLQSFPDDFNFAGMEAGYVCGMSVPPYMMNRISSQIYSQWLTLTP